MNQKTIRPYGNQTFSPVEGEEIFTEFDDRTKSDLVGYNSIDEVGQKVKNLEENQVSGHLVYTNYVDLPLVGDSQKSYKVSNDAASASNNGYYHWDNNTLTYVKDGETEIRHDLNKEILKTQALAEGMDAFTHALRVKEAGGNTINLIPLDQIIRENIRKVDMMTTPHGVSTGKVHSILPFDGTADLNYVRVGEQSYIDKYGVLNFAQDDMPVIEYDESGVPILVIHPQSTNLISYSEDFSNSSWIKHSSPVMSYNVETAPDGNVTADSIASNTSTYQRIGTAITVTPNSIHTVTIHVKKESSRTNYGGIGLVYQGGSNKTCYVVFDEVNGALMDVGGTISPTNMVVKDLGNYWIFSFTVADTGDNTSLDFSLYGTLSINGSSLSPGTGSSRVIWGAQLEEATFSTAYIPTSGTIATRFAPVLESGAISNLLNSEEGVLNLKLGVNGFSSVTREFSLSDNTLDNAIRVAFRADRTFQIITQSNGVLGVNFTTLSTIPAIYYENNREYDITVVWGDNRFEIYLDGQEIYLSNGFLSSSFTPPLLLNAFKNSDGSSANIFNGFLKSCSIFKSIASAKKAITYIQ